MIEALNSKYDFVLGSKSPRRSDLLEQLGLQFTIRSSPYEEVFDNDRSSHEMPTYLAEQKAESLKDTIHANEVLITADTLVILNDIILGKPKDEEDAFRMIRSLSGKWHEVITGMCLIQTSFTCTPSRRAASTTAAIPRATTMAMVSVTG